jgi:ComF family protein
VAPRCVACDEPLDEPTSGPVCSRCWRSIHPLTPPLCNRCGDALPSWRTASLPLLLCTRCRRGPSHISHARAVGPYEGALRAIVHALKYEGCRSLARPLATLMQERCPSVLAGADVVVPVPLHRSRRLTRGFNQADDLARALGPPISRALRRVRATQPQTSLPAGQRHRNVRDAFAPRPAARRLSGLTVVLVDDVSTTGATLEACALVLGRQGVREVRALTAARAVTALR